MVIGTMTECVVEEQNGSFQNQSIGRLKRRASVAARSLWRRFVQRNLPEEIPMLQLQKGPLCVFDRLTREELQRL